MVANMNPREACARPVHFQVVFSTTGLLKGEIEEFIYHQCYGYFGFAGPIKTPASAMYAKKVAHYALENKFSDLNLSLNDALQKSLHFLWVHTIQKWPKNDLVTFTFP